MRIKAWLFFYLVFFGSLLYMGCAIYRTIDSFPLIDRAPGSWTSELTPPSDLKETDQEHQVFTKIITKNVDVWKESDNSTAKTLTKFEERLRPEFSVKLKYWSLKTGGDLRTRSISTSIMYGDLHFGYYNELYTGVEIKISYPLLENTEISCSLKGDELSLKFKREFK